MMKKGKKLTAFTYAILRADLSDCLDGGTIFNQQFHHLHSVFLTSDVERSETILVERAREE